MDKLLDWLDDRTGYRDLLTDALYESIPGGARWRYVWGSTLVFTFAIQMITGVFLWMAYSPSAQTAWESVYYIEHQMVLGSVVRGIHHYAAQMMVVLLAVHLCQVIVDGAYRAPREINFWLGLILMQIVLGLSLTGYLLPWDQKGYYATQVTTKIVGATPFVGQELQTLAQGGTQYGHHTLTRFFAMHAGVLPASLIFFLVIHIYVFRRHGITVPDPDRKETEAFWPDQVFRDAVACLGVLAVILALAVFKGAELSGPANPSEAYSAARPEWYFLFLFRFLRFEMVEHYGLAFGAIYVPAAVMLIIALMPLIALVRGGHRFNVAFAGLLMVLIIGLTGLSLYEDSVDTQHQAALAEASRDGHRAVELAGGSEMIPIEGAGALLREDPFTQGPRLFSKYCASCHRYDGHNGRGRLVMDLDSETGSEAASLPTAPDLANFADREWWRRVLTDYRQLMSPLQHAGYDVETSTEEGMISWFEENAEALKNEANRADVDAMVEYLVSQSQRPGLNLNQELVQRGEEILSSGTLTEGEFTTCDNCHAELGGEFVVGTDNGGIPELNGYGSTAWLKAFIENAGSEQFYGEKNQMPVFAEKLSPKNLDLIVRWMTGDYAETEVEDYPSKKQELQGRLANRSSATSEPQSKPSP
ncbi:MAG: c-type cytochrome [Planctomycetaceae bacterium]|nr:c-type cytochrome [Planctomycetaceae bacterium]